MNLYRQGSDQKLRVKSKKGLYLLFLLLFICPCLSIARPIPADSLTSLYNVKYFLAAGLKPDSLGPVINIAGIANVGTGTFHEKYLQIYIQNDSIGIPLFKNSPDESITAGDSVVATGRIQIYMSQPELLVQHYQVFHHPKDHIKPLNIFKAFKTPSQHEGLLVHGSGIIKDKGQRANGKFIVIAPHDTSDESITVFVSNFNTHYRDFDFTTPSVGDAISVTGVIARYELYSPQNKNFSVYPRSADDLSYAGWPRYYFELSAIILGLIIIVSMGWMISLRLQVKRKTRALEKSLSEKKVLLQEIHHRVKNNLAIISGLLELQSGTSDSKEVQNALRECQSRINSMRMVHEKLYQSESLAAISIESYLRELAETIHHTFENASLNIDIHLHADAVDLQTDQVLPLGLLINELLVNAFKHAFKDRSEGIINIQLTRQAGTITLKVEDNGVGLPAETDSKDSLGMLLINTFSQQLQAQKTVQNTPGACFIFKFQVDQDK